MINRTADRRNDIVHRADRSEKDMGGAMQEVGVAWATQSVDTIKHVSLALDELVAEHVRELRAQVQAAAMPIDVATPS